MRPPYGRPGFLFCVAALDLFAERERPADDADSVPDILYSDWRPIIAAGARAFIRDNYAQWEDDNKMIRDRGIFNDGVADAKYALAKGSTRKPLRTRSRYF